jgi:hypothetical protein
MIDKTKLTKISTEQEYWKQNEIYNKRLEILEKKIKNPFELQKNSAKLFNEFFELIEEIEYIGLHSKEICDKIRNKISKKLNFINSLTNFDRKQLLEKIKKKKINVSEIAN